MYENLCRICGKIVGEEDPTNLFKYENQKILLQIKDLTGVWLKNNSSIPKYMCSVCKKDLIAAYTFREKFLKVQQSFETAHFTQIAKKRKNINTNHENFHPGDEKNKINSVDSGQLSKKENLAKDSKSTENMIAVAEVCITNQMSEAFQRDGDFGKRNTNNRYNSETEVLPNNKTMLTRKSTNSKKNTPNERENIGEKNKITKAGRKPEDVTKHKNVFMCDLCGSYIGCHRDFKLHLRRHSGDKQVACEFCPYKFFTTSELTRHMRRHTGEKPFACRHCERRFADYSTRLKHERIHTNERPFICSPCGKSFTASHTLKTHMLTHTGERHFKCDVCKRAYARRTHLVVHYRSHAHKQAVEKENRLTSQEESSQL